jgi:hypothetical protein
MTFNDIVDDISSQGRRKTDPEMVEVGLIYYGAILINRYSYKKDVSNLKGFINIYAMMFGSSASGKSFILGMIEKLCSLETLADQFKVMYEIITDQNPNGKVDPEIMRFMPSGPTVSLDGTKEGIYEVAKSVSESRFSSLNLIHDEFLDIVTSSNELLNMLKLAYDGSISHKVIKGERGDESAKHITDIVVNMMGAGSKDSVDKDTQKALARLAKTGMYRRSLIIDSKMLPTKNDMENVNLDNVRKWFKHIDTKHKDDFRKRVDNINKTGSFDKVFSISNEARGYVEVMDEALMDRSNADQLNPYKKYDVGSLNVIVNIAYIIAYIEGKDSVMIEHMHHAWEIFMRTRETTLDTFREVEPHAEVYDILKKKSNLTQSELMAISSSDCIPKAKHAFKDVMLLVQELAYRNNEELIQNEGIVVRYSIETLPATNLDKLILSFSTDDKFERATIYESVEFRWSDIVKLVTSHFRTEIDENGEEVQLGIQSFTCCHYDDSPKTEPLGHRGKDYMIQGQNVIAFDFDDGDTIAEIKEKFKHFKYCLYTTRSHNSLKSEYQDRFRVIVPVKNKFYVNPEQHKMLYKNIVEFFDIKPDTKCYNVSRMYFTNEIAETFINDSNDLFEISSFMPDTNTSDAVFKKIAAMKNAYSDVTEDQLDEIDRRLGGSMKWFVATTNVGNLKNNIYAMYKMVIDLTGDRDRAEIEIRKFQEIMNFPVKFIDTFMMDHR